MKKIIVLSIVFVGLSTTTYADTAFISDENREYSSHNRNNNKDNNQRSISEDKLHSNILKYLEKNYPGYSIMISKLEDNGYYYLKIKYNGNSYRPFYRSLVFDQNGNLVRG